MGVPRLAGLTETQHMGFRPGRMRWGPNDAGKALDLAAAGMFAAATGFAASALLGWTAGMLAAPAFVLAYGGLRRVDSGRRYALSDFALRPVEAPRGPSAQIAPDAGQALSDALAGLKRSLR